MTVCMRTLHMLIMGLDIATHAFIISTRGMRQCIFLTSIRGRVLVFLSWVNKVHGLRFEIWLWLDWLQSIVVIIWLIHTDNLYVTMPCPIMACPKLLTVTRTDLYNRHAFTCQKHYQCLILVELCKRRCTVREHCNREGLQGCPYRWLLLLFY